MSKIIENWWTEPGGDMFTAPEARGIVICGECDHPKAVKTGIIRTSTVKSVEGKVVKTLNSTYVLGTIKPQFLAYLKECGYTYDPENPIRMVDKLTFLEPKPN